ncbi:hypothetical protein Dimus_031521 [Dionaea muscipula]
MRSDGGEFVEFFVASHWIEEEGRLEVHRSMAEKTKGCLGIGDSDGVLLGSVPDFEFEFGNGEINKGGKAIA